MLTASQIALVESTGTAPLFAVEIQHSGISELLSTGSALIFDGRSYQGGGVSIRSIRDAESASIDLPFTPDRVREIQSGAWRGGICKIWAIIASPDDPPNTEYTSDDGYLRLDGRIKSSRLNGDRVSVSVTHVLAGSKISPRHTYNSVCSFIPASGATIVWEGDSITLESRR